MAQVSENITIERPVEKVFAFAGDYRNDPQWRTGVTEMTVSPDGEIAAGSTTHEVMHFAGKVYVTEANVVVWKRNQQTAFKSIAASMPVEGERLFERGSQDTRLIYNLTIHPQTLSEKLMMPVLTMIFRKQMRQDLKKLKALIEQN